MRIAIYQGLKKDAEKDKEPFTIEVVDGLLDNYFEKGGSEEDLREKLIEAYKIAWDPNGLASWKENLKILKRKNAALEKVRQIEMEKNLKENLAETENAEKSLKSLTGEQKAADLPQSS